MKMIRIKLSEKYCEALEVLHELLDNAEELNEEKYGRAFETAISAIMSDKMRLDFMLIMQDLLKKEFGEEWHNDFAARVAKEKLRRDIESFREAGNDEFADFITEHFDEITKD